MLSASKVVILNTYVKRFWKSLSLLTIMMQKTTDVRASFFLSLTLHLTLLTWIAGSNCSRSYITWVHYKCWKTCFSTLYCNYFFTILRYVCFIARSATLVVFYFFAKNNFSGNTTCRSFLFALLLTFTQELIKLGWINHACKFKRQPAIMLFCVHSAHPYNLRRLIAKLPR